MSNYLAAMTAPKDVDALLVILEHALEARKLLGGPESNATAGPLVTLWSQYQPHAQYALEMFASNNTLDLIHRASLYDDTGYPSIDDSKATQQIRTIEAVHNGQRVASIQFPKERIPMSVDASTAWSPAHADRQAL